MSYRESEGFFSRRRFLATGSGAVAAAAMTRPGTLFAEPRRGANLRRVALVGTGVRGNSMWGRSLVREYADVLEFVGLCDINPGRLEYAKQFIGVDCPTFLAADFDRMVEQQRPEIVMVTTKDSNHHEYIIRAMELGCDVITEKPLTTDETKAQAILDAAERTGRKVTVTFNYRYSPHRQTMKEILMSGRLGELTSMDFHWYLDTSHGADYYRRWHGKTSESGSLFVHKATHHFDLMNWWVDSEPEVVFGMAGLDYYGHNNAFRHTNCRGCPHASQCQHHWDITRSPSLVNLYVDHEHHDGYLRDGCVWDTAIDAPDKMAASIRYVNGVNVTWSCTTYSPYEGYRIAFNGTRGRMDAWIKERQPWEEPRQDEIRVTDNFGETEIITIPHGGGGHGGGDTRLKDRIFRDPSAPDPYHQAANERDGVMSVLMGVAALKSSQSGQPVRIADLTSLTPLEVRPKAV